MKKRPILLRIYGMVFLIAVMGCNGQPSQEMLAREKAISKIKEAEMAIDEYLLIIEQNHKYLIDERIKQISEYILELNKQLEDPKSIEKAEAKINMLQEQRKKLTEQMRYVKEVCEDGCDDFREKIDEIFKELDDHLTSVDSLVAYIYQESIILK